MSVALCDPAQHVVPRPKTQSSAETCINHSRRLGKYKVEIYLSAQGAAYSLEAGMWRWLEGVNAAGRSRRRDLY